MLAASGALRLGLLYAVSTAAGWPWTRVSHFDEETSRHFVETASPEAVKATALKEGRPAMILITWDGCPACRHLGETIRTSEEVRRLLPEFVVAHAERAEDQQYWGEGNYAPQTIFFHSDGTKMEDVVVDCEETPHSFGDADELAEGMREALDRAKSSRVRPRLRAW